MRILQGNASKVGAAIVNRFGIFILALVLAGCAGHPVDCATGLVAWNDCAPGTAGYQRRNEAQLSDRNRCAAYGFKEGSTEYAKCLMSLDQNRDQSNDALLRSVLARPLPTPAPTYNVRICNPGGMQADTCSYLR